MVSMVSFDLLGEIIVFTGAARNDLGTLSNTYLAFSLREIVFVQDSLSKANPPSEVPAKDVRCINV